MLKSTIIRVLAFAALFGYFLPAAFALFGFGSSFSFTGGIVSALAIGAGFMVLMMALLVAWGLAMSPFKLTPEARIKMWPWSTASVVAATMIALLRAHNLDFFALTVTGWLPALIGAGTAVGVLYVTMPAGSKSAGSQSAS